MHFSTSPPGDVCETNIDMLKSLTTQFALTLFFGPLGLAYSSMAAAVFLTLVLAVLVFTELGIYAVMVVWPIAIITGLVFVKTHNDGMRQSGSRLLLGPGEEGALVSTVGSWGRGLAVLSLLAVGGYLSYWYVSGPDSKKLLMESLSMETTTESNDIVAETTVKTVTAAETSSTEAASNESSQVITFGDNEVIPVVIGTSSESPADVVSPSDLLVVDAQMVNLRDGPGTNFSILDQVVRGDELQELDRAGLWVNVTSISTGVTGWIYSGLVSTR